MPYMLLFLLYCYHVILVELRRSKTDFDALKKQAEATNSEYDRLSSEFQKLQVICMVGLIVC